MVANDSTSMGLNYRRRVIYHALHDTFSDPQEVRRFFDLWQRDHSHEAHFVVTRFAAVVAKNAGFDAQQRSTFQRRLFHGLTQWNGLLPLIRHLGARLEVVTTSHTAGGVRHED